MFLAALFIITLSCKLSKCALIEWTHNAIAVQWHLRKQWDEINVMAWGKSQLAVEWNKLNVGLPWWLSLKNLPMVQELQETQVQSLGQKDPPQKEMATHSSILPWRIPWTKDPGGLWTGLKEHKLYVSVYEEFRNRWNKPLGLQVTAYLWEDSSLE